MSLYQHFRREEHAFVDQVLDWIETVRTEYRPKRTDFLDPRQQKIVRTILGTGDVLASFSGGAPDAERRRCLLYPDYFLPEVEDFDLAAFHVDYPLKFETVTHSQLLGSMMGIGLVREKFGDILISEEQVIQLLTCGDTADYVQQQLVQAGKVPLSLKRIPLDELLHKQEPETERTVTVSSLRLDVVLSEAFHLSRSKVKPLVQNEKAKVNWRPVTDPSMQLEEGDMLSLRGSGRVRLDRIEGETKRGKIRINIALIGG
ncbi:RNA-binding protein [Alkalicoccus urumqiensis]|uniref:RNA-binding protein n=1 Tax=Alkalicoccus urumqiensis TaxID=1548213 RepID=A0A2P6MGB3_ALKUR|nr:RNA-binding protein [Alkalicoccus urumqiensis]PRO65307.1 RNA-binding protein [Alkalicoccus urumqiensis]